MHRPRSLPRRVLTILTPLLVLAGIASVVSAFIVTTGPGVQASVARGAGFTGSVDGFEGWFGSYRMGEIGPAWCIDHGIPDPDPAYGYVASPVRDVSADVRAAMSWIVARWSRPDDAVASAAMVLALHDLMDAPYPSGPLEVFDLQPGDLHGFAGHEALVITYARLLELDGLAHRHLRAPFHVTAEAQPVEPGSSGAILVTATDTNGAAISGAVVAVRADGAQISGPVAARTDSSGTAEFAFTAGTGLNQFEAVLLTAPSEPETFAPTRRRAQRVIRPAFASARATTGFDNTDQPPPSTTTTISPTTTTSPSTTSTTASPASTTTTLPSTTTTILATTTTLAPGATAPQSSTTTSTTSSTTTSTAAAPTSPEASPPTQPTPTGQPDSGALAHTGSTADGLAAIGIGVALIGLAALLAKRRFSAAKPLHMPL